ncbi:putative bifunctional diguanylate cyclase/phosphodiesterase [Parasphingorhabdus sp.]|uniref:putative bifunctional diguanylate cyclase/phosphodiesterase n=1 Tax=Parasphingorhabdus sp. TaxID=2709688 RepID=UPI003A90E61F
MRLTAKLPSQLIPDLQAEQFRNLCKQVPTLYGVLLINTIVLCYSVYGAVPALLSIVVPGIFLSLVVVRATIWLARKDDSPGEERITKYLRSTTVIAGVVSIGLGVWSVALLQSDGDGHFVTLFIAFGAIACTYCLSSLPKAAFATVFCSTTPVIFELLTSGVHIEIAAGVNLLLIFLLILRLVMHQYNYLIESVTSRSQVKALAYSDSLTGLPNRRAFTECLEQTVNSASKNGEAVAVALIDLDGFKAINDTFGHASGDDVLIQAGVRLQKICQDCQMVARLGGDEFAVLMVADEASEKFGDIGNRLVLEMSRPFSLSDSNLRLSASVGLASPSERDTSALAVMSRADVALYEVKNRGGKAMSWFLPTMAERLKRRIIIEQSLRETNPAPMIEVVFQPIFDVQTKKIACFEALARWNHPQLGLIPPLEFIEIAEQTDSIAALSEQIFDAAIREATGWDPAIGLSINLSGVDLSRASTPLMILSLCNRYGFDPARLEVEVTETSLLSDFDTAREQLDLLRKTGIRIALDDFGSGFASITYLQQIKFDRVKIDGELIADIIHSRDARRLVQGIIQLCSAIGAPSTAEKVEGKDQVAVLGGLGCDRLQGYYLSPPVSKDKARDLANSQKLAA